MTLAKLYDAMMQGSWYEQQQTVTVRYFNNPNYVFWKGKAKDLKNMPSFKDYEVAEYLCDWSNGSITNPFNMDKIITVY